jgi:hypothetical protein
MLKSIGSALIFVMERIKSPGLLKFGKKAIPKTVVFIGQQLPTEKFMLYVLTSYVVRDKKKLHLWSRSLADVEPQIHLQSK